MSRPAKKETPKYTMSPRFERAIAALVISKPVAWKTIGRLLKQDAMPSREGKLIIMLAALAVGDSGGVPGGFPVVYQIAEVLSVEGGKEAAELAAALVWAERGWDDIEGRVVDEAAVMRSTIDEVKRYEKDAAAGKLLDSWGKKLDPDKAMAAYAKAQAIGDQEDRGTQVLTVADRMRVIREAQSVVLLPTGVVELDVGLGGGLALGNVGLIAAGSGDGKSSMLSQICAYTAGALRRVSAIASVELRERQNILKFEAALWGIPINVLKAKPELLDDRYTRLGHKVAPFFFRHWELKTGRPKIGDVFEWVDEQEQQTGTHVDVIGLDHFDRFDPSIAGGSKLTDYAKGEAVYDEIARHAYDRKSVAWVPSHCVRKKSGPLWGPGDMSHSQHKEKRADAVFSVTAGGKPGNRTITAWLFKNREGDANIIVGPKPVGFATGCAIDVAILAEVDDAYKDLLPEEDE